METKVVVSSCWWAAAPSAGCCGLQQWELLSAAAARQRCCEVHGRTEGLSLRCLPQPSALLLPSPCPDPPGSGATGLSLSPTWPLAWGRCLHHGTSLFWLQVRPRGSAGWESSLRQKPPVRLIFQAGQTRHEMKIKETNSVETLRDLPAPLRVRVCLGPGLPWGSGELHFCCALAKWLQTHCSLSVPQFPL